MNNVAARDWVSPLRLRHGPWARQYAIGGGTRAQRTALEVMVAKVDEDACADFGDILTAAGLTATTPTSDDSLDTLLTEIYALADELVRRAL